MAATTGHIHFLVFLLFLTSSSLRAQARLPNPFHKTTHFNFATEDSIPKEEEDEHYPTTSASRNPGRDGGLNGYSDPEKNSRETRTMYFNADAYELYDQEPLKSSPIGTNSNIQDEEEGGDDHEFELYHDQAIAEKKPLPFTSTSSKYHNYYDNTDKQYYYGMENGRYNDDDDSIKADAVEGGSHGRGYAASSTSSSQSNYNSNENEMYHHQQQQQKLSKETQVVI